MASKKNSEHVTGKLNNLNVKMAREKDCLSVTGKRKKVNFLRVNSCAVIHVPFAGGLPQKKCINPNIVHHPEIKYVNGVSCVDYWNVVQNVPNVPNFAIDLPVGARLHQFWGKWAALGASPNITSSPTIVNCYVNPHRNLYLL